MPLILPNDIANNTLADGDKVQQNFATIEDYTNQEVVVRDGSTAMTGALLLPGAPTQPNQAATKGYVDSVGLIGEIKIYGGDIEPANWMFARGQAISRATYAALFGVYGTKYGAGDGSTTFNLPDMRGQYAIGYNPGGAWFQQGLGQRGGWADATLVSHRHSLEQHTHSLANHHHEVHLGSGGQSQNHFHPDQGYGQYLFDGAGGNTFGVATTGANRYIGTSPSTNWGDRDHTHNVDGTTWGPSYNETGLATGHNTDLAGEAATHRNLPPSVALNFIVKVS